MAENERRNMIWQTNGAPIRLGDTHCLTANGVGQRIVVMGAALREAQEHIKALGAQCETTRVQLENAFKRLEALELRVNGGAK